MEACECLATRVPRASRFRVSQEGCSALAVAIGTSLSFRAEKALVEKYRRFTGRRGAPNTGKVIEIAKEKARPPDWHVTGAKNRKNRANKPGDRSCFGRINPSTESVEQTVGNPGAC
jgi:hypothetical protein